MKRLLSALGSLSFCRRKVFQLYYGNYYKIRCIFEEIETCKNRRMSIIFSKKDTSLTNSMIKLISLRSRLSFRVSWTKHSLITIVKDGYFIFYDNPFPRQLSKQIRSHRLTNQLIKVIYAFLGFLCFIILALDMTVYQICPCVTIFTHKSFLITKYFDKPCVKSTCTISLLSNLFK